MLIRAENDPKFPRKFFVMGLFAIGFSLWCLKDGFIGYPQSRELNFERYKEISKSLDPSYKSMHLDEFEVSADAKTLSDWNEYVHLSGIKTHADIVWQFIMAGITAALGIYLVTLPARSKGRWIEMDDDGIRTSWGESFHFDQVELLNKRRWRNKGIAKVTYRDNGRKRQFVIDDFKFMRGPTDEILYELEQRIGLEKIVHGPPETPPDEQLDHAGTAPPASAEGTA